MSFLSHEVALGSPKWVQLSDAGAGGGVEESLASLREGPPETFLWVMPGLTQGHLCNKSVLVG